MRHVALNVTKHVRVEEFKLAFADAVQSLPLDFVFIHQSHRLVVLHKDQLRPQQEEKKNFAELGPGPSTTGKKSLQNLLSTCNHIPEEKEINKSIKTDYLELVSLV